MKKLIKTGKKPVTLKIKISVDKVAHVRFSVRDAEHENTYFINRVQILTPTQTNSLHEIELRMPQTSENVVLEVYNNISKNDRNITLHPIKEESLASQLSLTNIANPFIYNMLELVQSFSLLIGYDIESDETIYSNDKKIKIQVFDKIMDNGVELITPCRINKHTKEIEVSKSKFINYPVPQRVALLLHEIGHGYDSRGNQRTVDEEAADKFAAQNYFALNYPILELLDIWSKLFYQNNTPDNAVRFDLFKKYCESIGHPKKLKQNNATR